MVFKRYADPMPVVTGTRAVDAKISSGLMVALFEKASPLHDGAACIEGDRLTWAGGILPVTGRIDLPSQFGTRHRAALGISEQTDAVALVLSEETGTYSLAKEGRITSRIEGAKLVERLEEALASH